MAKKIFPKGGFKIIPDSIVKGTGNGYEYCDTDPPHPDATKLKDRNRKYIYVHRVKMENSLGRFLDVDGGEEVHHIDENTANNSPSNLELGTKESHPRKHTKGPDANKFWEKSPKNKKKKESALRVVQSFISSLPS